MAESKGKRCYDNDTCPYHPIIEDQVRKSVPRWAFLVVLSGFALFAGWHVRSLDAFDTKYMREVKDFHKAAEQNRSILIEVRTKQEMILRKLEGEEDDLRRFNLYRKNKNRGE
jgi:hypothetical protein